MTESQFEMLRQELQALRLHIDQRWKEIDQRFDTVNERFDRVGTRLTKVEAQLDGKPDKAFLFQSAFTVNASLLAAIGFALLVVSSFLLPA